MGVVAPKTTNRRSVINGRTIRHASHHVSQRIRKRVEEPVGWVKTIAGGRKLRYIAQDRNRAWFDMPTAVYNLIRITALYARPACHQESRQQGDPNKSTGPLIARSDRRDRSRRTQLP
jgi:hypothetical protein